jgi:hypothetical protein
VIELAQLHGYHFDESDVFKGTSNNQYKWEILRT